MKSRFALFLIPALLIAGCAKLDESALDSAATALESARAAQADVYVSDLYLAAQDSFAVIQTEIETQNAASAFSRDYEHVDALIAFVTQTAGEAQAAVVERKEAVRVANDALFTQAATAIAGAQALLVRAPRGKDGAIALVSIREDAAAAQAALDQARAAQAAGEFAQARDLAQSAIDKATGLTGELQTAIDRVRRN